MSLSDLSPPALSIAVIIVFKSFICSVVNPAMLLLLVYVCVFALFSNADANTCCLSVINSCSLSTYARTIFELSLVNGCSEIPCYVCLST